MVLVIMFIELIPLYLIIILLSIYGSLYYIFGLTSNIIIEKASLLNSYRLPAVKYVFTIMYGI